MVRWWRATSFRFYSFLGPSPQLFPSPSIPPPLKKSGQWEEPISIINGSTWRREREATWNIITRKAWTAPPWRQQQPRRERQTEKHGGISDIFESTSPQSRLTTADLSCLFFSFVPLTDLFFHPLSCRCIQRDVGFVCSTSLFFQV